MGNDKRFNVGIGSNGADSPEGTAEFMSTRFGDTTLGRSSVTIK
jgi:hypothetical protein